MDSLKPPYKGYVYEAVQVTPEMAEHYKRFEAYARLKLTEGMAVGKRIKPEMMIQDAIVAMSDGNPGALTIMAALFEKKGDAAIWDILDLDDAQVYGSDIWIAYKDVCHENINDLIKLIPMKDLLRASILGAKRMTGDPR